VSDIEWTRRDDQAGPTPTRRDTTPSQVPSQREGSHLTRREDLPPGTPLIRLPSALVDRFEVLGELPAQGAESDLLHVRDATGTEFVVKIFRRGFTADRSVWQQLPTLDDTAVVRILETGHADGRDYEVIEYVPAGNLRALGARLSPEVVSEVVAQLADGLTRLHQAGIVHRDLKPENVLVRDTDPVRLAITDFGLSRVIEQSVVFASSSRTLAYAAPESLSGQVSPARDWWSLGMIVRELLTGHPPFVGMSETAVVDHLATRQIDCADIADPQMRLLCRGLLTRDPRRRWGGYETGQWLSGGSPAVAEPEAPAGSVLHEGHSDLRGLPFGGRSYADRAELARALVADWANAARYFFGTMFTPVGPSEAWSSLRDWLSGFTGDPEGRIRLVDTYLTGGHPADIKLLYLVRWLDPTMPPYLLGLRMAPGDLPTLAGLVDDPHHPEHARAVRAVRLVWERRLLPVLAESGDAGELASIDDRWQAAVADWNRHAGWLRSELPRTARRLPDAGTPGSDEPPIIMTTLLALAAAPNETRTALAEAARRARESVREPIPWFAWLTDQAGDDPLRLLAVIRATPDAVLEVEASARHRQETERRTAEGTLYWEGRERQRLEGRRPAITKAVLWTLPLLVIWLLGSWAAPQLLQSASVRSVTGSSSGSDPTPFLLVVAVLAWLVEAGCEVYLASAQGRDYLAIGPWSWLAKMLRGAGRGLSSASQKMSGATRQTGPRGCAVLALLTVVPLVFLLVIVSTLLSIAWLVWLAVLVMVPIVHVIATGVRIQRWRLAHEQAKQQALGTQA
jgi:eukaryotic-like serine/threonine-protein kinase